MEISKSYKLSFLNKDDPSDDENSLEPSDKPPKPEKDSSNNTTESDSTSDKNDDPTSISNDTEKVKKSDSLNSISMTNETETVNISDSLNSTIKENDELNSENEDTTTTKTVISNTNVYPNQNKSTNAVGRIGPSNYSISSPPYIVKSCDQILLIHATTFLDENDYSKRKPAFLTISIFMINIFDSADNTKLVNSIYMNDINRVPSVIKGSKDCVGFNDEKHNRNINMCYENPDEILNAFQAFTRCRSGDNLKGQKIKKIVIKKKCTKKKKKKDKGKQRAKFISKVPGS